MDSLSQELPAWVLWLAHDEDGAWWGYECEPLQHDTGWYENEVGRRIRLQWAGSSSDWRLSLTKIGK